MNQKRGIIFILISSLMFGSYGVWSKLIGPEWGSFFQGWTRGLIITLVLIPILLWKKQFIPIARKDWGWFTVFLLFTSLTQAPLFYAFNNMDIGAASLLFFVGVLLTMYTFGVFFLGEKLTKVKIFSFILALLGLYFVFSFSLLLFTILAATLAIINGIASGGEVASSKKLTGNYSPLYVSWLSWVIIVITNAPVSIILGETQHFPAFEMIWFWQICYVIASILGFWLIIKGLKYVEASVGGLIGLLEIVFSILFGIIIFSEELTPKIILGGVLIILAAALPHINKLREKIILSTKIQ